VYRKYQQFKCLTQQGKGPYEPEDGIPGKISRYTGFERSVHVNEEGV